MKKIRHILSLSVILLVVGIFISYYNTASLMYAKANIISFNSQEIVLFDNRIKYSDIEKKFDKVKEFLNIDPIPI